MVVYRVGNLVGGQSRRSLRAMLGLRVWLRGIISIFMPLSSEINLPNTQTWSTNLPTQIFLHLQPLLLFLPLPCHYRNPKTRKICLVLITGEGGGRGRHTQYCRYRFHGFPSPYFQQKPGIGEQWEWGGQWFIFQKEMRDIG